MKLFQSLTVSQSLGVVFASGLAVAVFFAGSIFQIALTRHEAAQLDQGLLQLTRTTGDLIHELQRERGLGASIRPGDDPLWRQELETQRHIVDGQFDLLANDLWVAELLDRLGKDRGSFRTWRTEVHRLRRELDTSEIAPSDFRNQMTKIDKGMVTKLAVAANHATSAAVAVMMRDSIAWIYAKDSAALEWALGAAMVAEGDQAKRLSYANALRAQTITTQARLDNVISTASSLGRSSIAARLDTQVIDDFEAFRTARLHDAVAHQTEGWGRDLRQTWFDLADAYMGELRAIEVAAQGRLTRAVEASGTEWWSFLQQQAILLIGLVTFFGSVAWLTIRAINASLQRIISTICHLSVDAPQTKVPECPQADLNQITDALRILRSVQLSRDRQQEESEQLRARLDRKLDEVLTAVDSGPVEDRIEVLGLDAQSATLARGVNRLLDQLERRASAS